MSDVNNSLDVDAIEASINEVAKQQPFPKRPTVVEIDRNREAMARVDRRVDAVALTIEAFVDEAIHARIVEVRGSYVAGPRDSYVRKMVLEAINSIENHNSHTLDR